MATALRRCFQVVYRNSSLRSRYIQSKINAKTGFSSRIVGVCTGGAVVAYYIFKHIEISPPKLPVILAKDVKDEKQGQSLTNHREERFLTFASVEYDGHVFMTAQDFLESVTEENPRPRIGRTKLSFKEVDRQLKNTPTKRKGSKKLFRLLEDKGLISYTEYLFLLCVLTKPHSGFRIAFNMFDTDGNQRVDKKEFLVLVDLFGVSFGPPEKIATDMQPKRELNLWQILSGQTDPGLERIITEHKQRQEAALQVDGDDTPKSNDFDLEKVRDTSLLVHFFGYRGNDTLSYEDFHRFMDNLQTEILELEFLEFSKGMTTITEEEFARVLLRYTTLSTEDYTEYLMRLRSRILQSKGVTFQDFKNFCQFLNSLDDFSIAMRMYTFADQPVSQDEFKRAVKVCTDKDLNPHLVNTVFQLFDSDGDGHLSHKEFISIMKDRLHRGFRSHLLQQSKLDTFKNCLKNEMRKT